MSNSSIKWLSRQKGLLERIFATKLNDVVGMARVHFGRYPLQLLVVVLSSWRPWLHIDLARFGSERVFSPRQADMLMVMGTISKKWSLFYVRYTNKCQNQDGLLQSALVLLQEVFSDTQSSRN
jgi:hypothetical protein